MITKEQAQATLDAGPNQLVRFASHMDAMRTVVALHERVERLTDLLDRAINGPWLDGDLDRALAILKETTHD